VETVRKLVIGQETALVCVTALEVAVREADESINYWKSRLSNQTGLDEGIKAYIFFWEGEKAKQEAAKEELRKALSWAR